MPKIIYVDKRLSRVALQMIATADRIATEYAAAGDDMTVRQLYYVFVAQDLFPDDRTWTWNGRKWVRDPNGTKNAEPNYKWLQNLISDGRRAGLIDWEHVTDRTRFLREYSMWSGPESIVGACAEQFTVDFWQNQSWRPEVWIEKDALVGVIERPCRALQVPYFSCRGYVSDSEVWGAAQRLKKYVVEGHNPVVFHLGDHDPSGIDMTRDIRERLDLFSGGVSIRIERLALTMEQIEEQQPPPNPAKMTDARFKAYEAEYGDESWELDALTPAYIRTLVEDNIRKLIKPKAWERSEQQRDEGRENLSRVAEHWPEAVAATDY